MRTRADRMAVLREARALLAARADADTFELSRDELLALLELCDSSEEPGAAMERGR